MWSSSRFVAFMYSVSLVHLLMFIVLAAAPEHLPMVAVSGYGFLGAFGVVTGGSKIAEKWKYGQQSERD